LGKELPLTNANDSAFVQDKEAADDGVHSYRVRNGLTKREYFAAMAMQGLRSAGLSDAITETEQGRKLWSSSSIANQAVYDADALIAELSK
jgi:hypothetical protein